MRKSQKSGKNTHIGVYFILAVSLVLIASFLFKAIDLYRSSLFNGQTDFNLLIRSNDSLQVVSLSPQNDSIDLILLKGYDEKALPIDRTVTSDLISRNRVNSALFSKLMDAKVNPFDLIKINIYANSVDDKNIEEIIIDDSVSDESLLIDALSDPTIVKEGMTVEVENSSGVKGVGSNVASLLSNMGVNVILVTTGKEVKDKSEIVVESKSSQTVDLIRRRTGIKAISYSSPSVSDIKIIVGEDIHQEYK